MALRRLPEAEKRKLARVQSIHDLRAAGWSEGRIALALGCSRALLHKLAGPRSNVPAQPVAPRAIRPDLTQPKRKPTGGRVLGVYTV